MTDRELLVMAAKAAGINIEWNPLADDGDALRLAVRLGIDIEVNHESKTASTRWLNKKGNPASVTDYLTVYFGDGDPHAATRRAITRAAAEIARGMK